jgi:putative membrane protein
MTRLPDHMLPMTKTTALATDLLIGIAAGLVASGAMNLFQAAVAKAIHQPESGESAATKAADAASQAVSGKPVKRTVKKTADQVVHYATGAVMGGIYGVVGGMVSTLMAAKGLLYGAGTWLVADELAVPLLGLAPKPNRTKLRDHVFALASHLVFGLTLDWSRRRLNQAIAARRS